MCIVNVSCVNVSCAGDVEVFMGRDGQRGVRAKRAFKAGEFVMEFEGNLLSMVVLEREYDKEDVPVYRDKKNTMRDSDYI